MKKDGFRAQLPDDLDPGEAELLEAYDRWVHERCQNPERIGCPDRATLMAFVLAKTKFEDEYTLDHIGLCAACVDELLEIRKELESQD